MAETIKAFGRRVREGWFEHYCPANKSGIDIGCSTDPVQPTFDRYDMIYFGKEEESKEGIRYFGGDATFMAEVKDESYNTVYASHVLEHLIDPMTAIKNWFRILKPGGHLIICVPHRDLYEKRTELPSRWNGDHKSFWLPVVGDDKHTRGLFRTVLAVLPEQVNNIVSLRVLDYGYESNGDSHSGGEYSIEIIIKK